MPSEEAGIRFEIYDSALHGGLARADRSDSEAWENLFRTAARRPVVVYNVPRPALYYRARQRGLKVSVRQLRDGNGYVVSVSGP